MREIINGLYPKALKWRIILFFAALFFLTSSYLWLFDPVTYEFGFFTSLQKHPELVVSFFILIIVLFMGAHKKVVLPNVIAHRSRLMLAEYNMSCDNSGKLILRPKPNMG